MVHKKLTLREKRERRESKERRVMMECYDAWLLAKKENPEKYPEEKPALNRTQATYWGGYSTYWSKCKYGHIAERDVKKAQCPICYKVSRSLRDAKIRGGNTVPLTTEEKKEVAHIYAEARRLSIETGIQYHVDHIRPLAAGGVHHPSNLRVVTAEENISKGSLFGGKRRTYSTKEKAELRKEFNESLSQKRREALKSRKEKWGAWDYIVLSPLATVLAVLIFSALSKIF